MRPHRFFIEQRIVGQTGTDVQRGELSVPDPSLAHQLRSVFRLQEGDQVILLDNSGLECVASIVSLDKGGAVFHIESTEENRNIPRRRAILFQSLIKKDNFEWVVEKATELGVNAIVPVLSERSEKKAINPDRCRKIIKEASEQSGRGRMPELHKTVPLDQAIRTLSSERSAGIAFVAFDPKGETFEKGKIEKEKISREQQEKAIGALIGPEGGWSEDELKLMRDARIPVFSLGSQVLRAETAAISVLALLLL